jgi:hypothetical protein
MNLPEILSTEVRVALAPLDTYSRLTLPEEQVPWLAAFARPAFVALLIGSVVAISSTGRVTLGLVAGVALCWSVVPALQMAIGALVIASARGRGVAMPHALDLLFAGHLPWSVWLLVAAAWVTFSGVPFAFGRTLALSLLVPAAWTARIVFAFCRTVLGDTARGALLRTVAHQTIVWIVGLAYVVLAGGVWPRILNAVGR